MPLLTFALRQRLTTFVFDMSSILLDHTNFEHVFSRKGRLAPSVSFERGSLSASPVSHAIRSCGSILTSRSASSTVTTGQASAGDLYDLMPSSGSRRLLILPFPIADSILTELPEVAFVAPGSYSSAVSNILTFTC